MTVKYRTKKSAIDWHVQPDSTLGLQYASPKNFSASGVGAADGSTIVSTGLAAYSTDNGSMVGKIARCVEEGTENKWLMREIIAWVHATGTATLDGALPEQVATDDQFELMDSPEAQVIVDTGDTSTALRVRDATRNEADGYWNGTTEEGGYYLEPVEADNVTGAAIRRVSKFTQGGGSFTLDAALPGATVLGDYFRVTKFPDTTGFLDMTREPIGRDPHTGGHGAPASTLGLPSITGSFELSKRGPGTTRKGDAAEMHEPLRCTMTPTAGSDSTAAGSSSGTSVKYSSGNHSVGELILTEGGDVAMVVADDAVDTYTVDPAPRTDPLVGETLYGGMNYEPSETLRKAMCITQYKGDGIKQRAYGAVPLPSFKAAKGAYLGVSFNIVAPHYLESPLITERLWFARLPSTDQVACGSGRVNIGGVECEGIELTCDPGFETVELENLDAPDCVDGYDIANSRATGTVTVRATANTVDLLNKAMSGHEVGMLYQDGAAPGHPGVGALWFRKVRFSKVPTNDANKKLVFAAAFEVVRDESGLALGLPQMAWGLF